ncbi:DNRLRE domain-containing protein [Patescibacteria group bacterium]
MTNKIVAITVFCSFLILTSTKNISLAQNEITLEPTDRVSLTNREPAVTRSAVQLLRISYTEGNKGEFVSFLNFDISEIPQNADIKFANLYLVFEESSDTQNIIFTLKKLSQPWKQHTITWNTRPEIIGKTYTVEPFQYEEGGQTIVRLDVSALLRDWVKKKAQIYGFQISGPTDVTYHKHYYAGKNNIHPKLKVSYTVVPDTKTTVKMEANLEQPNEPTPATENSTKSGGLPGELDSLLTAQNIKVAAIAVFVLLVLRIVFSKK